MRIASTRIPLLLVLVALAGVTVALAATARSPATTARRNRRARTALDCKDLEAKLNQCALHIVAASDPEVAVRLRKMSPALRKAVVTTFTDEFIGKVVAPCQRRRGTVPGAAPIARCLAQVKGAQKQTCPKLAACLTQAMGKLPPVKVPNAKK